jgi:hypothetical protein
LALLYLLFDSLLFLFEFVVLINVQWLTGLGVEREGREGKEMGWLLEIGER